MTQLFRRIMRPLFARRIVSDVPPDSGAKLAPDTHAPERRPRAHRSHASALDRIEL